MGVDREGMSGHRAVLLDRDGVITALAVDPRSGVPESPYHPEDVAILPGAAAAIERLAGAGFALGVVSNQPAAAKGFVDAAELDAVHARTVELLGAAAGAVGHWGYCRHHPDALDPALRQCDCRKPKPGLLLDAAAALGADRSGSWMVGDSDVDIQAGQAGGFRTVLIEHGDSAHRRKHGSDPELRAEDLGGAVAAILAADDPG
jgi:D-glycero-D-manno-heptose 1,7-bisphosphate phosphatase